jgi:hypothetical protein
LIRRERLAAFRMLPIRSDDSQAAVARTRQATILNMIWLPSRWPLQSLYPDQPDPFPSSTSSRLPVPFQQPTFQRLRNKPTIRRGEVVCRATARTSQMNWSR